MLSIKKQSSRALPSITVLAFSALLLPANAAASTKVAFIADQGTGENAQSVLSLIFNEGADLLMIQGDLGYEDNTADTWEDNLDNFLGSDFPVLTVVGNHEGFEWPLYQKHIQRRIDRVSGLSCSGNTGVKAKCSFGNIDIVQISPGIYEVGGVSADDGYADFIDSSFAEPSDGWRICGWHKPEKLLQTGRKTGPGDWSIYDACMDAGAMVALGHEHAYSRTYELNDFSTQSVAHRSNEISLQPGSSFAVVSGFGGREAREQKRGGDYFASIYTGSQGAAAGALFCDFGDTTADCYFKAINGAVPDQFTLRRGNKSAQSQPDYQASIPPPASAPMALTDSDGYVLARTDKDEFRWIAHNDQGEMGSTWISSSCAIEQGGATASGDWDELMALAPAFDSIAGPCRGSELGEQGDLPDDGYVFSRTDKDEYRWIAMNSSGVLGSVWMDEDCVDRMGGVRASGDWDELMRSAPGIDSPCY